MKKVKIIKSPTFPLNSAGNKLYPDPTSHSEKDVAVGRTAQEVPKHLANVEAEKGETIVKLNAGGLPANFNIGGKSHEAGGTPLNAGPGDFIFSDVIVIKDPEILKLFNKTRAMSSAKISKQYDLNKQRQILASDKYDKLDKETAEDNIKNFNLKLGQLALVQESMKGFENGIPEIAMPYLMINDINPEEILPQEPQIARRGGSVFVPMMFQDGGPIDYDKLLQDPTLSGSQRASIETDKMNAIQEAMNVASQGAKKAISETKRLQEVQKQIEQAKTNNQSTTQTSPKTSNQYPGMTSSTQGVMTNATAKNVNVRMPIGANALPYANPGQTGNNLWDGDNYNTKWVPWVQNKLKDDKNVIKVRDAVKASASVGGKDFSPEITRRIEAAGDDINKLRDILIYEGTDGKVGPFHQALASILEESPQAPTTITIEDKDKVKTPVGAIPDPTVELTPDKHFDGNAPFWLQDQVNIAGALMDKASIKKYMPWAPKVSPDFMEPTFMDPERMLAANAEQSAIASQALGAFSGPQAMSSRLSSITGQGVKNAADILANYQNQNVGIANNAEASNTATQNEYAKFNASLASKLWDQGVIANQEFTNSNNRSNAEIRKQLNSGITNRAMAQVMNNLYDQYYVDPSMGGIMTFTKGKKLEAGTPLANKMQKIVSQVDMIPGLSEDARSKLIVALMKSDSDNTSQNSKLDYLQALMKMMGQ